jgi:hypothetical protein
VIRHLKFDDETAELWLLSGIRAFDLAPKSLDQIAEAGLARRNAGELLGVIERRGARCAPGGGLPVCFRVLVLG